MPAAGSRVVARADSGARCGARAGEARARARGAGGTPTYRATALWEMWLESRRPLAPCSCRRRCTGTPGYVLIV